MMDSSLLCNNLKCRRELIGRALITTCSHAFCLDCVQRLHLVRDIAAKQTLVCPACHSTLSRDQDTGIANIVPSETYKAIVLSGQSPSVVLECTQRALSFWSYQKTQEMHYQQHVYKVLADKHSKLKSQFNETVAEANTEISRLQTIIEGTVKDYERVCRTNEELIVAHRDKSRRLLQAQELYHKARADFEKGNIPRRVASMVEQITPFHWQTPRRNLSDTKPCDNVYHWPLSGRNLETDVVTTKPRRHRSNRERPSHHMTLTRHSTLSRQS